jgi:uncharacterized protein with HEPN domain
VGCSYVPWQQMAGLRDVLIHDYLKVNLNLIWQIVEDNLSELQEQVSAILDSLNES